MQQPLNENQGFNLKNPSYIVRNLYGIALITLGSAVITLFLMYIDLNIYIRNDLVKEKDKTENTINTFYKLVQELQKR